MTAKRDRRKPKRIRLKAAIEAVLADETEMETLALWAEPDGYDEDGPYLSDPEGLAHHEAALRARLTEIVGAIDRVLEGSARRGRPSNGAGPDLSELDRKILDRARAFHVRTGKLACNGAQGSNITNDGGPFVREAARTLKVSEPRIMSRIRRMQKHAILRSLWDRARGATRHMFTEQR